MTKMHNFIHRVTEKVSTKKGVAITLILWIVAAIILSFIAPGSKSDAVNSVSHLYPDNSPSVIAQEKLDTYFADDEGIPGIVVLEGKDDLKVDPKEVAQFTEALIDTDAAYVKTIVPFHKMPEQALATFTSEDKQAMFIPVLFDEGLTSKEIKEGIEDLQPVFDNYNQMDIYMTGPAGIAVDTTDLFSRADLVLLFSTVGIILILLIFTYRSPLLALIPLLAAGFVYAVVDRILGLMGEMGVELASQSLSIMMILLFAVVIDYSLFIFSRFKEELMIRESKYEAMRYALKEISIPIFYSSSTIFLAMLVLFLADFGDYKNFAPIFSTAIVVVLIAAMTLVPALFTLFGRKAFWPKVPKLGQTDKAESKLWRGVGKLVSNKPIASIIAITIFLLIASSHVFNIENEYNTMKSFPEDMPSRVGYEVLENKFSSGTLAPTKVVYESDQAISEADLDNLSDALEDEPLVNDVRLSNTSENEKAALFELTFSEDPYSQKTMAALDEIMLDENNILSQAKIQGDLYFAGETASSLDSKNINYRDLIIIVLAESLLIFGMLIFLTRSVTISSIMMGTILFSFVAALGIGTWLSSIFFGVDAISNRVPVYAFVFLVALGIDYNIFLVSRYMEEKKKYSVRQAVENAITHTGGIISSAGIILAATFAVLMTQPVEVLSTFGFIVALGIIIDTFLVRAVLLPGLLILVEKNSHIRLLKKSK